MKRIFCILLLVSIFILSVIGITAYAEEGRAEIEFFVGDETLLINNSPVKVEKPYVVGAGVTLVPIRVITEAFGAEVSWEEETRTVKIAYPDINIVLQINNPIAEVNGKAETLLSAPELSGGGYTMVPLRFISENFGAEVSYEETTGKIKVVKENKKNEGSTVESAITNKYVGDSYFGWSMETPSNMYMDERSFDGTYTSFTYDDENYFYIAIQTPGKDYDFEKDFSENKAATQGFSLVKADKDTSDAKKKTMHIQARDKVSFIDFYRFITDKYCVTVSGWFQNEKTDIKNEFSGIMATFDMNFSHDDIYDLSNVHDGFRKFTADNLNLSFNVFADYILMSDEDAENMFVFRKFSGDDFISGIDFVVYSKDSVAGAEQLAYEDYSYNKRSLNESIASFDALVQQRTYGKLNVYEYNYSVKAASYSSADKDVFFELGDYVYNISICFKLPENKNEELAAAVIGSIEAGAINFDAVGPLMRNKFEPEGTFVSSKLRNCSVTLPNIYSEYQMQNIVQYINGNNGITITAWAEYKDDGYTILQMKEMAKELEKKQKTGEGVKSVKATTDEALGGNKAFKYILSVDYPNSETRAYVENYFIMNKISDSVYVFSVEYPELVYSQNAKKEINDILSSISFK